MYRILLISDGLKDDTATVLQSSGFSVDEYASGSVPDLGHHDLVVVNTDANRSTFLDRLRSIRSKSNVPLIVMASLAGVAESVVALELGADDFIHKPVAELELVARVKCLIRRSKEGSVTPSTIRVDDIELQSASRHIKVAGVPVYLTGVEFELLRLLMQSAGTVVTREVIAREIFRRRPQTCNRSIDVHMSSLRRKLGVHGHGRSDRIRTIRGLGYIVVDGSP